jgi:crotonobetainyl-CoA:carnitine CoA-transferase CaiB-like acyl-CoA transferase
MEHDDLPLSGLRVIEFTHMVMGPTCGMILADLGAEVIKVEPPGGDKTRSLPGLGIGFFRSFNRNKKSVILDIHAPEGHATAIELIRGADVVLENFRPGLMAKLGLDYATLSEANPRLIYVSHKGFLPVPYENRLALDEVVQNMAGLTYMTGPTAGRFAQARASTTSWAACSARSACSPRCASASAPARARRSRARCSRTAACSPRSTCSSSR